MPLAFRASLCLLTLILALLGPAHAQSQSSSATLNSPSTPATELAAALAKASSEEEQERLLTKDKDLVNSSLLTLLKDLARPLVQKGEYAQALRISELAIRIAERIGDRNGLGDALVDIGAIYLRQNRWEVGLEYLQKGLAIHEETGNKKGIARTLYNIGVYHRVRSHSDQALEYLNRSMTLSKESGEKGLFALALTNVGMIRRLQGEYELALEFYGKSLTISEELNDKAAIKIALNSVGNVYQAQGNYEFALEFYRKSLALCQELNDRVSMIVSLYNIGAVYNLQGRYAEALSYFQKSIKFCEEMGSNANKGDLAYNFHSLALLYRNQGRYDQAMEYNRKSLEIREEINDKFGIASSQNNIGVIYKSLGLYDQALEWFRKSLKLDEEIGVKEGIATGLGNIGDIYRLQGRYDLALEHLSKSLKIREEIGNRRGICGALKHLSKLYQDQGNYPEMLEVSRRTAQLADEINSPEDLWVAQEFMGRALRAMGQTAAARRSFLDAITTVESLRHHVAGGNQQQQSFFEDKLSPWLGMIDLLISEKDYAEALSFAEGSKSRVLLDVLQAGPASLRKSLSPQERHAEEERRLRLVSLNSSLAGMLQLNQPDGARIAELKESIEKARLEYEALETNLYVAHPELKVYRGESPVIKSDDLAALLPNDAGALLEFVVTDNQTYLFTIVHGAGKTGVEVTVYTLPINRAELTEQIESFRQQLAGRDLGFRPAAARLYELLLKPAQTRLRGKTNLVIVPDDKLWDLPFQALLTGANRFLIEDAVISYAPSLTVLRQMKRRQDERGHANSTALLAIGNPIVGQATVERANRAQRGEKLNPLPEAEREVKALGQLYGTSQSKVYTGVEAREDRVKTEAGKARILHFATHGILNNASPMYSHLVLAQGDTNEDGLLEAWEVMELDLKADLAVLSACETARGRFGAGEGMIGLTWALFVAGVPSTVVSQWKVESAGTRDLMLSFHRRLQMPSTAKARVTKAEALREAALSLMKKPQTAHPFYWAGFVLVGESR